MQYDISFALGPSEEPGADAGVIFRGGRDHLDSGGDDDYEGYYAGIRVDKNLVLGMVNGAFNTLNTTSLGSWFNPFVWHLMRITAQGSDITIEIDGQIVIQHRDSTYSSGWTGLHVHRVSAMFDELRILNSPDPQSTPTKSNIRPLGSYLPAM